MAATAWEEVTRAELFVRGDLPTPAQKCRHTVVSHLEDLVASDALEEFTVTSWAKRVPTERSSDVGKFERDLHETFTSWSRSAGVRLQPFFDTRECYSATTGERQTQLVMPAVCVALYEDEDLVGVAPHVEGTDPVSVRDCLERLAPDPTDEPSATLTTAG